MTRGTRRSRHRTIYSEIPRVYEALKSSNVKKLVFWLRCITKQMYANDYVSNMFHVIKYGDLGRISTDKN